MLVPGRLVALGWTLCLAALFAIGTMGRPGILRIYVPLLSLLLVAPLVVVECRESIRRRLVALTLFTACMGDAYILIPPALESEQWIQQIQMDIHTLPTGSIVSWADSFPYEFAFPVLANDPKSRNLRLYGLDSFTHAPFSVTTAEQTAGRGMIQRLRTADGVQLISSIQDINHLGIYCEEHLNSNLRKITTHHTRSLTVHQVRCENSSDNSR